MRSLSWMLDIHEIYPTSISGDAGTLPIPPDKQKHTYIRCDRLPFSWMLGIRAISCLTDVLRDAGTSQISPNKSTPLLFRILRLSFSDAGHPCNTIPTGTFPEMPDIPRTAHPIVDFSSSPSAPFTSLPPRHYVCALPRSQDERNDDCHYSEALAIAVSLSISLS